MTGRGRSKPSHNRVLYCGVTNDLRRRIAEHKSGTAPGFTSCYRVDRLVHAEGFRTPREAIAREKQIKRWRRDKKVHMIETHNPDWKDLSLWEQGPPEPGDSDTYTRRKPNTPPTASSRAESRRDAAEGSGHRRLGPCP